MVEQSAHICSMNTFKRHFMAYVAAVVPFSAIIALVGLTLGLFSGNFTDSLYGYGLVLFGAIVTLTVALVPVSPLVVWAAGRSWGIKIAVVALIPLYFLLAGLIVRWVIWPYEVIRREPFESALWYWLLPSMVVAVFFFVIEENLRRRGRRTDPSD